MIEFPRDQQNTIPTSSLKIIGLGGAGANMLDRIALDGIEGAELVAMNTDARTLAGSVATEKITLGRNLTKGLGSGGDPELGQQAVLEAEKEIRATIKGRRIIFLCVGLGGGTGSGGAPIIARIAREEGAFVVVFATMPFVFEGKRRREQADTSLNELAVLSNALVTFDNNRMGELVLAKQGIHEAFVTADRMISESIKAVIRLVIRPGLINVGLDELMSALRTTRSRCLFGSGIANGKDRASRALRAALSSPLLDQGTLLKDAQTVLVHLCGGEDLTLYEIELLMQGLMKYVPERAHILFGAAVDPSMGGDLSITLISALPEDSLASAPRQSLTRIAADEPTLNPSIGFDRQQETPAPIPTPPAASLPTPPAPPTPVLAPTPVLDPAPVADITPETTPEVQPTAASVPDPVEEEDVVRITPPPVYKSNKQVSARATNERPLRNSEIEQLFDTPFAEPEQDSKAMPESEPEPQPAPESAIIQSTSIEENRPLELANIPDFAEVLSSEEEFARPVRSRPEPSVEFTDEPRSEQTDEAPVPAPLEQQVAAVQAQTVEPPAPRGKAKSTSAQPELSLDGGPRGRFSGETPNFYEGEDLDIPPFMRKKKS